MAIAVGLLIFSTYVGWRVGKIPTDRVSELLLIFYNMGGTYSASQPTSS
ncbi:hypothetical protein [Thermococcus peptonophilus]